MCEINKQQQNVQKTQIITQNRQLQTETGHQKMDRLLDLKNLSEERLYSNMDEAASADELTMKAGAVSFDARAAEKALNEKKEQRHEEMKELSTHGDFINLSNVMQATTFDGKDSPTMKAVKLNLSQLTNLMNTKIGSVQELTGQGLDNLMAAYTRLHEACQTYENSHNPLSRNGKARLRMVKALRCKCAEEYAALKMATDDFLHSLHDGERVEDHTYSDVLFHVRCIHVSDEDYIDGKTGGAMSEVHKVRVDGKTFFFVREVPLENGDVVKLIERLLNNEAINDSAKLYLRIIGNSFISARDALMDAAGEDETKKREAKDKIKALHDYVLNTILSGEFWGSTVEKPKPEDFEWDETTRPVLHELERTNSKGVKSIQNLDAYLKGLKPKGLISMTFPLRAANIHKGAAAIRRNVATSRVADKLGIGDMVARSNNAVVNIDGVLEKGNLMEEAKGRPLASLQSYANKHGLSINLSTKAAKQLQFGLILDTICGMVDHHGGNIIADFTMQGKSLIIKSIKFIDNDMSFGKRRDKDFTKGFYECHPLRLPNGDLNFKRFDADLYEKIMALSGEDLEFELKDLDINAEEIEAAKTRLDDLKKVLEDHKKEMEANNQNFLIKEKEWDNLQDLTEIFEDPQKTHLRRAGNDTEERRQLYDNVNKNRIINPVNNNYDDDDLLDTVMF